MTYLFLSLFVTGIFTELDFLGVPVTLALAVWGAVLGFQNPQLKFPSRPSRNQIGWGFLFCLPVALYFLGTWNQEFPDSGDHLHHLWAQESAWRFWHKRILLVFLFIGILWGVLPAVLKRKTDFSKISKYWPALILALLYWWSFRAHVEPYFARYPGTQYTLAYFTDEVLRFFQLNQPLLAGRLTNALSVPVWLFVLRPLLLKRWPGPELQFFVAFYFLQEQVLYHFTSLLLEPWACIFVALATEALVLTIRGESFAKTALLSLGFAAIVKEHAVFLFPGFALAFFPGFSREKLKPYLIHLITAVIPFLLYLYFRKKSGVSRDADLVLNDMNFFTSRWGEWFFLLKSSQNVAGLVALVLSLCAFAALLFRPKTFRLGIAFFIAVFFPLFFFYLDRNSAHWTGYPRFHLLPFVVLGAPLLGFGHGIFSQIHFSKTGNVVRAVAAVFSAVLIAGSIPYFQKAFAPAYARNFIEHYDSPYFYPVRELLKQAPAHPKLKVVWPLGTDQVYDLRMVYSTELREVVPENKKFLEDCVCKSNSESVLVLELPLVGLGVRSLQKLGKSLHHPDLQRACFESVSKSCANIRQARDPIHDTRNGFIAWGVR